MVKFFDVLRLSDTRVYAWDSSGDVHYLQSQNGNLFTSRYFDGSGDENPSEFTPLREHIPSEIPWCSDALGTLHDSC